VRFLLDVNASGTWVQWLIDGGHDVVQVVDEDARMAEGGVPGLRRLLLPRSRYHVCYVHDSENDEVAILAVWSAVRGRGPKLDG